MGKRILLMHISNISGHKEASAAIQRALELLDPDATVLSINIFEYTGPTIAKIITDLYMKTIKKAPVIWGFLYDNQKLISGTRKIKEFVYSRGYKKIKTLIESFDPDVVVATQAFPCGVCAEYKRRFNAKFKLIGVMTDHAPHAYWFEDGVDYYIVGSEELKQKVIEKGISHDKIKPFGIPIDLKFREIIVRDRVLHKLGLNKGLPIVLVMGGGQGLGPIKKIIRSLNKLELYFQIILVCGTNKKLETQIKKKIKKFSKKINVFGFVKNIEELMAVSSIVITKPGGLTTSEALASGVAMVLVSPIPGQEVLNAKYLVEKNVAVHVKDIRKINEAVEEILLNKNKLEDMRRNTLVIGKPNASIDIAKLALSLC